MSDLTPESSSSAVELQKLGDALARPAIRKAFKVDPLGALERAGVNVKLVDPEVIDLFAGLSDEELDVLGRVADRAKRIPDLKAAGDHVGVIIH